MDGTVRNTHPRSSRTACQWAMVIQRQAPPVHAINILDLQRKVSQSSHERHSSVQPRRQNVVMPRPPPFISSVNHEAKDDSHRAPHDVVNRPRRRHRAGGAEDDGHVDKPEPFLVGI